MDNQSISRITRIIVVAGANGTGKTSTTIVLADYLQTKGRSVQLLDLDLDTSNTNVGCLSAVLPNSHKINVHTKAGRKALHDHASSGASHVLVDMDAGAASVAMECFDCVYPESKEAGIVFTVIGVITGDPKSVESVLGWASRLQGKASFLIIKNDIFGAGGTFDYFDNTPRVRDYLDAFNPPIIHFDNRSAELEYLTRLHRLSLSQVANNETNVPGLQKMGLVVHAQRHRQAIFSEFDRVQNLLTNTN